MLPTKQTSTLKLCAWKENTMAKITFLEYNKKI